MGTRYDTLKPICKRTPPNQKDLQILSDFGGHTGALSHKTRLITSLTMGDWTLSTALLLSPKDEREGGTESFKSLITRLVALATQGLSKSRLINTTKDTFIALRAGNSKDLGAGRGFSATDGKLTFNMLTIKFWKFGLWYRESNPEPHTGKARAPPQLGLHLSVCEHS